MHASVSSAAGVALRKPLGWELTNGSFSKRISVCDEDATLELKVKTVKYFKGIQETQEKVLGIPMEGYAGRVVREASPMLLMLLLLLA